MLNFRIKSVLFLLFHVFYNISHVFWSISFEIIRTGQRPNLFDPWQWNHKFMHISEIWPKIHNLYTEEPCLNLCKQIIECQIHQQEIINEYHQNLSKPFFFLLRHSGLITTGEHFDTQFLFLFIINLDLLFQVLNAL